MCRAAILQPDGSARPGEQGAQQNTPGTEDQQQALRRRHWNFNVDGTWGWLPSLSFEYNNFDGEAGVAHRPQTTETTDTVGAVPATNAGSETAEAQESAVSDSVGREAQELQAAFPDVSLEDICRVIRETGSVGAAVDRLLLEAASTSTQADGLGGSSVVHSPASDGSEGGSPGFGLGHTESEWTEVEASEDRTGNVEIRTEVSVGEDGAEPVGMRRRLAYEAAVRRLGGDGQ